MPRRGDPALLVTFALLLAGLPGCADRTPKPATVAVGHHRVRFVLPEGWEHLDHGRQQLFRNGETQISLADLGPGTREGLVRELRAADRLWRAGRRGDAFQRVRGLHGPALRFAPSPLRADFWRPWTDVTYIPDHADSAAVVAAFESLIAGTGMFPPVSRESMIEYVLTSISNDQRREIGHRDRRKIHGADWTVVETWDRVSHLYRSRVAFVDDRGYLLVLAFDHGLFEPAAPAFEALLTSLEVTPDTTLAR